MKYRLVVAALLVVAAASLVVGARVGAQSSSSGAWLTLQHDSQRTGAAAIPGPGSQTPAVVFQLPGCLKTPCSKKNGDMNSTTTPVIDANGNVYFGASDGNIYGYHLTGTYTPLKGFPVQLDGGIDSAPTLSSDGTVLYAATDAGNLYAIKTADGSQKWSKPFNPGSAIQDSPVLSANGNYVIVGAGNGLVYGVNTSDGSQAWKASRNFGGPILSSPALSPDGSMVFVGGPDAEMHGVNVATGTAGVSFQAASGFVETPSLDSSANQYAGNPDGYLYSYNTSGSFNWNNAPVLIGGLLSGTALSSSHVYVGSSTGKLYAVNTSDGSIAWSAPLDAQVAQTSAPVADSAGNVYVATVDGGVYGFSSTGSTLWSITETSAQFLRSPAIAPPAGSSTGYLFAPSATGYVYAIGQLPSIATPPPPTATPTLPPGVTPSPTATTAATATKTTVSTTPTTVATSPGVTTTPTATKTKTPKRLHVTLKTSSKQVNPGRRQIIHGKAGAGRARVHILITYPNSQTTKHTLTAKPHGKYSWSFVIPSSKILPGSIRARVAVKSAAGARHGKAAGSFDIGFGPVDVAALPRSNAAGKQENVWVHSQRGAHISIEIVYNGSRHVKVYGVYRSNWFHTGVRLPRLSGHGTHSIPVYAWSTFHRKTYFTYTTFALK